ncbi:hypothetical protein BKA62DRAFT_705268 [Auriculariales sp. MPI-PUGE-AT-0066]|nr:hypothetical protein BKA62DRAFT_705268 [Auriculariales sp. MPI-PUGE-AT-0066]
MSTLAYLKPNLCVWNERYSHLPMPCCSIIPAIFAISRVGEAPDPAATFFRHHVMPVTDVIYPVLDSTPMISGLQQYVRLIGQVNSSDTRFGERLDQCHVTLIAHYRSKSTYAHEVLVVRMEYAAGNNVQTRFFRLEKFRVDTTQDAARSGTRGWSRLSFDTISSALQSAERCDSVRVSDQLNDKAGSVLPDDYKLVREFSVAPGTITLLETLVIADILSARLIKYTNLVHMCQFWTANLFLTLKAIVGNRQSGEFSIRTGPAVREAGNFAGFAIVDIYTGRPTTEFLHAGEVQLKKICSAISTKRMSEENTKQVIVSIRADIQQLSGIVVDNASPSGTFNGSGTSENNISPGAVMVEAREAFDSLRIQIRTKCEGARFTS